jgi:prepilin-type N-terminal cleavage/methylation domain-containing protein
MPMKRPLLRRQSGFTLLELTSVLIIIGLIVSAISIGKDLQRTAEFHKIKQKFIDQWAEAYNQYYMRTGDEQTEPRFMVGGATLDYPRNGNLPGIPGYGVKGTPGKICHGQGYGYNKSSRGDRHLARPRVVNGVRVPVDLLFLMDKHGIRMPPARGEGREDRYVYLDTNGNPQEIQVCFQWNPAGQRHGSGNMMLIRGLTPDIARMLDEMIDGKADATEGVFRQQDITSNRVGTHGRSGKEWGANNTFAADAPQPTAEGSGANRDEDSITLVTAHYKMNQ